MRSTILNILRSTVTGVALLSVALVGCGDDTTGGDTTGGDTGGTEDAGMTDTGMTDSGTGGTDAETDAEADAEMDAEADAEMDAEADAEMDAEADAEMDAEADAEMDAMPDVSGPECGDGTLDDGEGCDDGNTADGDGCSMFCDVCEDDDIASSGTSEESFEFDYGASVEDVVAQAGLDDWYQVLLLPGCQAVFEIEYDTELGDVSIVLLDAAREELATSESTESGARVEWSDDSGGFFASTLFIGVVAETDGACIDYSITSVRRCG